VCSWISFIDSNSFCIEQEEDEEEEEEERKKIQMGRK
jgi:hypothetical protein